MKAKQLNYAKGKIGEDKAKEFLEAKGFKFIESNYENFLGEVDLIMTDKDTLVFIEVKYKETDNFGKPEEMIQKAKLRQVRRVADSFLLINSEYKKLYSKYRIDAVCILGEKVNYYKNLY